MHLNKKSKPRVLNFLGILTHNPHVKYKYISKTIFSSHQNQFYLDLMLNGIVCIVYMSFVN